ncbi:MAG: pyrroline-5-carboxylate reductase [Candidatus Lokiarchaeota archaeon]|nr:pyrroline-5-carboxylate reductase [Candidatus Lokiarchaeota archaeon]MBD3201028.1 pyrroline-5-carboxylate reductase [Candidatus Lokiarchaeota archaeon]
MYEKKLGIIGIGKIGSTLLKAAVKLIGADKITTYDINTEVLNSTSKIYKVDTSANNMELVEKSKYILIAVLPQVIDDVLGEIGKLIKKDQIIISIAAGVSISHINRFISEEYQIVRVMSNVAALIGEAATAISKNRHVNQENLKFILNLFKSVGLVVELDERHLDAVTGLSGSGPAYIFLIIEALADGGVKMGLPREVALKLSAQTVLGSAKLLLETNSHPAALKDKVASPGGTTITALHLLESDKLRASLITAVEAATKKSRALNTQK